MGSFLAVREEEEEEEEEEEGEEEGGGGTRKSVMRWRERKQSTADGHLLP